MSLTPTRRLDAVTQPRILLADADENLRQLVRHSVPEGIGVEWMPDAPGDRPADIVIADIDSPDASDVERLREIRHNRPGAKVIVISSGRDPNITAELLRQRAFSILIRPISAVRLSDAIERALHATDWEEDIEVLSGTPQWVQVRVRCKLAAAERAVEIFRELPGDFTPEEHEEMATAFREMLMNAIEHGCGSDPTKAIEVSYVWTKLSLMFYIRDPGPGFCMTNLPHAAISNRDGTFEHADIREQKGIRPGGFGILLAKNLVDELIYSGRCNEVILIKHRKRS